MSAPASSVDRSARPASRFALDGAGAWIVWGIGAVCYMVALFHRASLGVAAPQALERFSAGPALLSVFSALQLGVYLALQIPAGVLADRLGPRRVISAGMLCLAVGSAVFGLGASAAGGIVGRMLIGFGDAFMFTNVLRLAAHWFTPRRFGKIAALTGLAGGLGQVVATLPLSLALDTAGWVATFLIAAVATAALAAVAAAFLRNRPPESAPEVPRAGSGPAERVVDSLGAVVRQRGTRYSFWVHFVLMAQFVAITTLWGGPWLTEAQGRGPAEVGSLLLLCVAGFLVGTWFSGQFVAGRHRRREGFTLGMSLLVVLCWSVLVLWPGVLPSAVLLVVLLAIGFAGGAAMLAFDGARAANTAERSGTASGVVNMGGFTAAVLVQLLVGLVLQLVSEVPAAAAYRWAFAPVLVLLVAGAVAQVASSSLRRRRV
ncbi:MFS transporter [Salinifilum aidingensis]